MEDNHSWQRKRLTKPNLDHEVCLTPLKCYYTFFTVALASLRQAQVQNRGQAHC